MLSIEHVRLEVSGRVSLGSFCFRLPCLVRVSFQSAFRLGPRRLFPPDSVKLDAKLFYI
jgi:hypothetical protein